MINDIIKLYKDDQKLTLLEIAYLAITIVSFGVAGIIALFNQPLGVSILMVPLVSLVAGIMNIVAWSLVKLIIEHLIATRKEQKAAEKAATKASKSSKSTKK